MNIEEQPAAANANPAADIPAFAEHAHEAAEDDSNQKLVQKEHISLDDAIDQVGLGWYQLLLAQIGTFAIS